MIKPTPESLTYTLTLAIASGHSDLANDLRNQIDKSPDIRKSVGDWLGFLSAYQQYQFLPSDDSVALVPERLNANRQVQVAFHYLRGMSMTRKLTELGVDELSSEHRTMLSNAMIELLTIPALYENQYPELSAAALFQSARLAERLGRTRDVRILTNELVSRFPKTYHASGKDRNANN